MPCSEERTGIYFRLGKPEPAFREPGDTITVWVMPHDDPEVGWVVNDRADMVGNWDDLVDQEIAQGSFDDYLASWTCLEMPKRLWLDGPRWKVNAWVEAKVNG